MERIIKFRGKRNDGVFVAGNLLQGSGRAFIHIKDQSLTSTHIFEVEPSTVGQFTGLVDCNNKEIYEGDFVKTTPVPLLKCQTNWIDYSRGEVKWLRCGFLVCQQYVGANRLHYYRFSDDEPAALEVVGNIYEQPELV